jgi:hypothetical protein
LIGRWVSKPKPALDLVEPGGMGGSEMERVTRALEQPAFDQLGLGGGVVVEHQMDLELGRDGAIEEVEKLAELLAAMSGKTSADDLAGGKIQGREKARLCHAESNRACAVRAGRVAGAEWAVSGSGPGSDSSHPHIAPGRGPAGSDKGRPWSRTFWTSCGSLGEDEGLAAVKL